jgi:transcription factor C subunit 3
MVVLGPVDCAACLNEAWLGFIKHLSPEERDDAQWVIDAVCRAGTTGVRKSRLMVRLVLALEL